MDYYSLDFHNYYSRLKRIYNSMCSNHVFYITMSTTSILPHFRRQAGMGAKYSTLLSNRQKQGKMDVEVDYKISYIDYIACI